MGSFVDCHPLVSPKWPWYGSQSTECSTNSFRLTLSPPPRNFHVAYLKKKKFNSIIASDPRICLSFQLPIAYYLNIVTRNLSPPMRPIPMKYRPFFSAVLKDSLDSVSDFWKSGFDSAGMSFVSDNHTWVKRDSPGINSLAFVPPSVLTPNLRIHSMRNR